MIGDRTCPGNPGNRIIACEDVINRFVLRYIAPLKRKNSNDIVTVLLPEFVPPSGGHLLHNQSSLMLKGALLFKEGVIVISVPYHLKG
jgi:hypothetical protein